MTYFEHQRLDWLNHVLDDPDCGRFFCLKKMATMNLERENLMAKSKINQADAGPSATARAGNGIVPKMWNRNNPAPKSPGPWTPAVIPNLSVFLQAKSPYCFVDDPPTVEAANGQHYAYQVPLFGTVNNGEQAIDKPTVTATGMQLDALGVESLSLHSPVELDYDFTIYCTGFRSGPGVQGAMMLGSLAGQAGLGFIFGQFMVLDDAGSGGNVGAMDAITGNLLVTARKHNGFCRVQATGVAESSDLGIGSMTFDQVGQALGAGGSNDSADNRTRLTIIVDRFIALGSVEDLLIRAWIVANDGAMI